MRRFDTYVPEASRDERAAALLHDVGKCESSLGWWGRILATLFGARTKQCGVYLRHEEIGVELLQHVSTPRTLHVLTGDSDDKCVAALRSADNV